MGCSSLARRLLVPIVASGPFAVAALSADELPNYIIEFRLADKVFGP